MGLLDQVLSGALGSRTDQQHGGSSALMTALMTLLSSGALSGATGHQGGGAGGLGDLLGGMAGNGNSGATPMPGGGMGGLGGLVQSFQRAGHGDVLQSWIRPDQNHEISPNQLGEAIGYGTVDDLSRQTGMDRGDLLAELSKVLPGIIDQMTPHGRLPNKDEMAKW